MTQCIMFVAVALYTLSYLCSAGGSYVMTAVIELLSIGERWLIDKQHRLKD